MAKLKRQMIQVDEEKCDGCGNCIPACPEGALQVIEGKARVVRESYCDGLGACLGDCPQGALTVVEVEADAYDGEAVVAHLRQTAPHLVERHVNHLQAHGMAPAPVFPACPSAQVRLWDEAEAPPAGPVSAEAVEGPRARSELRQWPVQLHLLPPHAPFFDGAKLTLVADCVPFANANFHADFVKGSAVAMGCPKLDDAMAYVDRLTQILQRSDVRSLRVAYMEVPCCRGLVAVAQRALAASGKDIPMETVLVKINDA